MFTFISKILKTASKFNVPMKMTSQTSTFDVIDDVVIINTPCKIPRKYVSVHAVYKHSYYKYLKKKMMLMLIPTNIFILLLIIFCYLDENYESKY